MGSQVTQWWWFCLPSRRQRFDPWIGKIPWRRKWATHSRTLAWKIPWTEKPGWLQSMGSQRVRHDWVTSLSLFTFIFILTVGLCSCYWNSFDFQKCVFSHYQTWDQSLAIKIINFRLPLKGSSAYSKGAPCFSGGQSSHCLISYC